MHLNVLLVLLGFALGFAPSPQEKKPPDAAEAEMRARLGGRKAQALERLDDARREQKEARKEAARKAEALAARLAGKPVTLTLLSGETHRAAVIRAYSFDDVEIESGGRTVSLLWNAVAPASVLAAAKVLFDGGDAEQDIECARFLITRRLWREAREALARAVKKDDAIEGRTADILPVLERLISGQGVFRGATRRIGLDGLTLAYDFQDERQIQDFTPGLALYGGKAVFETKEKRHVGLSGGTTTVRLLDFVGELDVQVKAASDVPFSFQLFRNMKSGYEIVLGPDGTALHRLDAMGERTLLARSDRAKMPKGKTAEVRISAHHRKFKVFLDRQEALSFDDPPASVDEGALCGAFLIGLDKGKAVFHPPFTFHGRLNPEDLGKRFSEVEILVRRAVDPDLQDIESLRQREMAFQLLGASGSDLKLTADDGYFIFRIRTNQDLAKYDEVKQSLAEFLAGNAGPKPAREGLERLIGLYPDVPSLHYLRGLLLYRDDDLEGARRDVDRALALFPSFAEALVLDAHLRFDMSDPEGALDSLRRALEVLPDHAPAYVLRAIVTFSRDPGRAGEALDDLRLALAISPSNPEAAAVLRVVKYESRGPRALGCRFNHESEHYSVTTDISPAVAKLYADRLEAVLRHFAAAFRYDLSSKPFRKPRVAVFNTAENYYTYFELISETRGEFSLGVFRRAFNEFVLFEDVDLEATLDTLYHEAFHHFLTLLTPRTPPFWYNEGMAEYMAAVTVRDGRVAESGRLQRGRLSWLQGAMRKGYAPLPFRKIMCETPREFYSGNVNLKYAQAWSMVHFLRHADGGAHAPLVDRYFAELRRARTPAEAFQEVFCAQAEDLQKRWRKYVLDLKP